MYENPELAYQEYEASARLSSYLAEHGFEVTYPAYGLDTAFEANVGSAGPRVVICCEYDALPGVGHACAHNLIATSALGAGIALANLAEELGIRLTILGTPAEEDIGGKVDLINAGAFEDVAASIMVHPVGDGDVVDAIALAIQAFSVEYHGRASHASGAPQLGINALDAQIQAYNNVSTFRQHMLPSDRVHGVITHGGDVANVIPAYTRSEWMIRATTEPRLTDLIGLMTNCFEAAATATGCTLTMTPDSHPYLEMRSNPVMADIYSSNSAELGRPMTRWVDLDNKQAGSTDMGNVSQLVPALHPCLFLGGGKATNHQPEFAAATVTSDGHSALRDGALGMAWTIIDMAEQDVWDRL